MTATSRGIVIKLIIATALVALGVWIVRHTYWDTITVPQSLRGEAEFHPFYSVQHLVERLGARGEWRHSLGELPPTHAVMLLTHWNWDVIAARRERLEQWVQAGGRLIMDDSFIASGKTFTSWSGIERFELPKHHDEEADDDTENDSDDSHPFESFLHDEGRCVPVETVSGARVYKLCHTTSWQVLRSTSVAAWGVRNQLGLQAVRVNIGKGSVTVFNAAPFGNRELLYGDHGLLFVAASQLRRGDAVYFLSEEVRESLLALMWRVGAPVIVLLLLALAAGLWRDSLRFGPAAAALSSARRSLAEQIRGTGQFTIEFGGGRALQAAAVRALHEAAARQLPGYMRLSNEARIALLAQHVGMQADQLAEAINYQGRHRAAELRRALAMLERARRHLLERHHSEVNQ